MAWHLWCDGNDKFSVVAGCCRHVGISGAVNVYISCDNGMQQVLDFLFLLEKNTQGFRNSLFLMTNCLSTLG